MQAARSARPAGGEETSFEGAGSVGEGVWGPASAVVRLPDTFQPWAQSRRPNGGVSASVSGAAWAGDRFLTTPELAEFLAGEAASLPPEARAERLQRLCLELNGWWAFVVRWPDGDVAAAVDRLRSMPLFFGKLPDGRLAVSCSVASLADCEDAGTLDHEAAAELMLSGYVMDSRTMLRGISQLQPGELLHARGGHLVRRRYHLFLRTGASTESREVLTGRLHERMDEVFARLTRQFAGRRIVVPLSGGIDSRLIVAMLKRHGHRDLLALNYGRADSQESQSSRAVAEALGVPWAFVPYDEGDWYPLMSSDSMREFWHRAGQAASLPHLQDYLALDRLRRRDPGMDGVFFPGYVGDMIAGTWTPTRALYRRHMLSPLGLSGPGRTVSLDTVATWLFLLNYIHWPATREAGEAIKARIHTLFETAPLNAQHNAASATDLYMFQNREARYLGNAVRSFESFGYGWWLPLCDNDLMDFFVTVPTPLRKSKRLYAEWTRSKIFVGGMSQLAEIPACGGARTVWYGAPKFDIRTALGEVAQSERGRTLAGLYASIEPDFLHDIRIARALRSSTPTDLRFCEWFVAGQAEARSVKLSDLMRGPGAPLAGLPADLEAYLHQRERHPIRLVYSVALLSAAFVADVARTAT